MANLIPTTYVKKSNRDTMMRIILALSFAVLFCTSVTVLGLLPAYFDIRIEYAERSLVLKTLTPSEKEANQSERAVIQNARKRIVALDAVAQPQRISTALQTAIESRPKGMVISMLTYSRKDGASSLSIHGAAADSSGVKSYAEVLRGATIFKKVTVPLTSLAYTEGGGFSITAEGGF